MTASLRQLASVEAYQAFRERYGRPPVWMALAPGRVNLIGEHVDYNDGFVLPMAIDRYTVVAAAPLRTTSESSRVYSRAIRASCEIPHGERTPQQLTDMPHWARYVAGTFNTCRYAGLVAPPLELLIHSTVPVGGGLSSSAALEVATATLLETICERALDPRDKVLRCQQAEHEYAGMPCGVMDQFAVTLGQADHALLLDCRSLQVQPIPLGESAPRVLIINSNVKHELGNSAYAMRRAECQQAAELLGVASLRDVTPSRLAQAGRDLPDSLYRRARHVVTEIERTTALADAFQIQEWRRAGELMHASHVSLRDDYEVSCQELDLLVELTQSQGVERGVFGSRMTGGGFGGCTVSLVEAATADEVAADVVAQYRTATGITPHAFCTQAAAGAERINLSTMAESVANDGLS